MYRLPGQSAHIWRPGCCPDRDALVLPADAADAQPGGVVAALAGEQPGQGGGAPAPVGSSVLAKATVISMPPSGCGWVVMVALCAVAMACTMDNPRPRPP